MHTVYKDVKEDDEDMQLSRCPEDMKASPPSTTNLASTMTMRRRLNNIISRPLLLTCFVVVCCGLVFVLSGYQTSLKEALYPVQLGLDGRGTIHVHQQLLESTPARYSTTGVTLRRVDDNTLASNRMPGHDGTHSGGENKGLENRRQDNDVVDGDESVSRSTMTPTKTSAPSSSEPVVSTDSDRDILLRQIDRKKVLRDTCEKRKLEIGGNFLYKDTFRHVYVIDEHKLLFCYIPKVGCSNWKRVLMVLDGKRDAADDITSREAHAHNGLTVLGRITPAEQLYRLKNYRKVMFVREPLARVVSAYRNKFADMGVYRVAPGVFHKFGKRIVAKYRENPSPLAIATGENVTWTEFVKYLTSEEERSDFDRHWKEMYKLCSPCQIDYDFIGKLEHAEDEAEYVLRTMINANQPVGFPGRANSHPTNVSVSTAQYFNSFSQGTLRKLWEIYHTDYELFGYQKPDYIH